jgi:hemoglobin
MTISLYQRLGGDEGIAAHLANPLVKTRFKEIRDMTHTKQLVSEFFTASLGSPPTYTGKGMLGAHKGASVSEQEFQAAINDIVGAMNKNGMDEGSKNDILAIL